jgi:hypothetical protein
LLRNLLALYSAAYFVPAVVPVSPSAKMTQFQSRKIKQVYLLKNVYNARIVCMVNAPLYMPIKVADSNHHYLLVARKTFQVTLKIGIFLSNLR